ncbi:MAG: cadherin-like domain-containing protein, partial [Thermoanaerobaculia bacterium]|nr:cadherin-like domain-containing protein [Thermoanaerobaculia bacterium]
DYQGYVVLKAYPVEIGPFGSVSIDLEGYCVNAHRPPVPDGETIADVAQWVSWGAGDALPVPGKVPGAGFVPMPAALRGDPLALSFPGSNEPFLYAIDFNRYPRAAARLLLHAAYAAETAFDALNKDGKIRTVSGQERRAETVQQALWAYAARLEGRNYNQAVFKAQLTEEAEQNLNLPQASFSTETEQQAEQFANDVWSNIELVGANAKLIAPRQDRAGDTFKETPVGAPTAPAELLPGLIGNINPEHTTAGNKLIAPLLFFQNNAEIPALQALQQSAAQKWERYLRHQIGRIEPENAEALPELLQLAGLLQSPAGRGLGQDASQSLLHHLTEKLNGHVRLSAGALSPGDPAYIGKWRRLKSWPATHWYRTFCSTANPLQTLPLSIPAKALKTATNGALATGNLSLANAQWKHLFPVIVAAKPHRFAWWIPAAGIPVLGGGLYFLLRDKGGETPEPPRANPDAVSLPCGDTAELDVLANDSGEGITVSAANAPPGISISAIHQQHVVIVSAQAGTFTANYTIKDASGQTASSTILITVTDLNPPVISCPVSATLEGCSHFPAPAPTFTGQAAATDDCDPAPDVQYADEPGGTPCNRV